MADEPWTPNENHSWRDDPTVMMQASPKKSTTWVVFTREGQTFVKASDRVAAGLSWTGLLHCVYKAARMSPAFREECGRVLAIAHLDSIGDKVPRE